MLKGLLRAVVVNLFVLWLTTVIINGFQIRGGGQSLLIAALVFSVINLLVKPLLKILLFPVNLLTMGLFSWVINVLVLYLLNYLLPQVAVTAWHFDGWTYQGFSAPEISFGIISTYIVISFVISLLTNFLNWL